MPGTEEKSPDSQKTNTTFLIKALTQDPASLERFLLEATSKQFIELVKVSGMTAVKLVKSEALQQFITQKATVADFIELAKVSDMTAEELAKSEAIQQFIAQKATVADFVELARVSSMVARELAKSKVIRQFIIQKATVIELAQVCCIADESEAAPVKQFIAQNATADDFIKIAKINCMFALLPSVEIQKRIAKVLNKELLTEIKKIDKVGKWLLPLLKSTHANSQMYEEAYKSLRTHQEIVHDYKLDSIKELFKQQAKKSCAANSAVLAIQLLYDMNLDDRKKLELSVYGEIKDASTSEANPYKLLNFLSDIFEFTVVNANPSNFPNVDPEIFKKIILKPQLSEISHLAILLNENMILFPCPNINHMNLLFKKEDMFFRYEPREPKLYFSNNLQDIIPLEVNWGLYLISLSKSLKPSAVDDLQKIIHSPDHAPIRRYS